MMVLLWVFGGDFKNQILVIYNQSQSKYEKMWAFTPSANQKAGRVESHLNTVVDIQPKDNWDDSI